MVHARRLWFFCGVWLLTAQASAVPRDLPGLHNVHEVMLGLYSGSSPEGDAGFASLQKLKVKTIVSVDGARPDVERARRLGMRYVHIPIAYSTVPGEAGLRLAKAIRDLPGAVYLHCHHGKHRGPAAAAVARLCLDRTCAVEDALAFMNKAGTDKRYMGLFDAVKNLQRPTKADLDRVPAHFPEVTPASNLVQAMVEIDESFENLRLARKSAWKTPREHPDIDPPHEALILAQHFAASAKTIEQKELARFLAEAKTHADEMERLLRQVKSGAKVESRLLENAFSTMNMDCMRCHEKFRDTK